MLVFNAKWYETDFIVPVVVVPIAVSTLLLTVNHFRSLKQCKFYILLIIIIYTNGAGFLYYLLFNKPDHLLHLYRTSFSSWFWFLFL
jgi:hypothetical protein